MCGYAGTWPVHYENQPITPELKYALINNPHKSNPKTKYGYCCTRLKTQATSEHYCQSLTRPARCSRYCALVIIVISFSLWKISFCHMERASTYFKNVEVKSIGGINEVQSARRDRDGELVVEDLAVQLSLEQLWFPGLSETI